MATRTSQEFSRYQLARYEFINSLTSIRSLAELLVDYPELNRHDRMRFLVKMQKETERLMGLMAELTPDIIDDQCVWGVSRLTLELASNER